MIKSCMAMAAFLCAAAPAVGHGQVFLASRPHPEFLVGPLFVVANVSPGLGAWLPLHEHHTLTSFVPPHTHAYEHQSSAPSGAVCEATPHSHTSAQDVHVVCTTTDDLSSGALAVVVPDAPVALPGVPASSTSSVVGSTPRTLDPHASVVTPPPRP